jgi:hypothetical protein
MPRTVDGDQARQVLGEKPKNNRKRRVKKKRVEKELLCALIQASADIVNTAIVIVMNITNAFQANT